MVPRSTARELQTSPGERLRDHAVEPLTIQRERPDGRHRRDGRVPRRRSKETDLAEVRTGPERRNLYAALRDLRLSRSDDVEQVGRLALPDQGRSRWHRRPVSVIQELGEAGGPKRSERGELSSAPPVPASSVRSPARGSNRKADDRTSPCRSRTAPLRRPLARSPPAARPAASPSRRTSRPARACEAPARRRCPDPPPRRRPHLAVRRRRLSVDPLDGRRAGPDGARGASRGRPDR